jgi:hypothetical protein
MRNSRVPIFFAAMGVLLGVDFFLGAEFTKQYALYVGSFKLENPMVVEKKD